MAKLVAVTGCPTGIAHTKMAAEALKKAARDMGHDIKVEIQGAEGVRDELPAQAIAEADAVIISSDIHVVRMERFADKPMYAATTSESIRKPKIVIEEALAEAEEMEEEIAPPAEAPEEEPVEESRFLVGVTSCPTGIAHTFMAAEGLRKGAEALGHEMKVETQGSVGAKNVLTPEEIARAYAVVIAADAFVDKARFEGKRIYETSTKQAIHDGKEVVKTALARPAPEKVDYSARVKEVKKARSAGRTGLYRHLMTGVSYMLPVVVAGGILIALAFAFGGINAGDQEGTIGWALMQIGGATAFALFVPVLGGFIAYSIADRPGIAPGLVGGMLANTVGAGFLGAIVAGFLAGYLTKLMNDYIKLPEGLQGLKPVLILPVLSTLIVGLLMIYVIGPPVEVALNALTSWLTGMQQSSAVILGLILGGMMAFDMGGPVNKAAYSVSVGLLSSEIYAPMAAVMAAGMTPPLGLALATLLFKDRFTEDEQEAGAAAAVMGISFITEGAIPFAAADPLRVIPSIMVGSAVTGALSMVFGCQLLVPHGGIFVLPIPNAVRNLPMYVVSIAVGTAITTGMLYFLKKPVAERAEQAAAAAA